MTSVKQPAGTLSGYVDYDQGLSTGASPPTSYHRKQRRGSAWREGVLRLYGDSYKIARRHVFLDQDCDSIETRITSPKGVDELVHNAPIYLTIELERTGHVPHTVDQGRRRRRYI